MIQSMYTRSGVLVIISKIKFKEKWRFLRSLRFRITLILVVIGIIPSIIIENGIVHSYEDRAVNLRTVTVKNQCDILCNQLVKLGYMEDSSNPVINGEFSMLTNIYGGRIQIIDRDFRVIKDTYDLDSGKFMVSQEVIECFGGKETSRYDRRDHYIEMTIGIQNPETKELQGVMLVSVSTIEIQASMDILEQKGMMLLSASHW